MDDGWATVFSGPIWVAQMVRDRLEDERVECFLPDETTKVVDPFITGGSALEVAVLVREADAERAEAVVATLRTPSEGEEEREEKGEDEAEEGDEEEDVGGDLDWLAKRTRWAGLITLTAPFAVFTGFLYLLACRKEKRRAPYHGLTVAGFVWSTVVLLWALYRLARALL